MTKLAPLVRLLWFLVRCILVGAAATEGDDFAIAGYLPDYRLRTYLDQTQQWNGNSKKPNPKRRDSGSSVFVTDLVLFSLQPHARGFIGCCLQEDHYDLVEEFLNSTLPSSPFPEAPTTTGQSPFVWVTLGGGGRTGAFPELCTSSRSRQRLIGSVLALASRRSFLGGIDLDFFQPRTIQERDNYVSFLNEAIPQWNNHGLRVSLTLHPYQGRMIPPDVYQKLDRIHFMTYDMVGESSDSNYHASLAKVRRAVEDLLQPGGGLSQTPEKVLLGIPAYARHTGNPSRVKTFGEIYDDVSPDEAAKGRSRDGYEWESPSRIRAKIDLSKELKLGGIFFWELGQDKITTEHPGGVLLEAAFAAASVGSLAPEAEL